ncbi:hypothetical protein P3G55_01760 [Leptospira sp. 96542]|nr:hypothetical protein [Leptospira sp. 96542]
MAVHRLVTGILAFSILTQTLFLGSGLLGFCLESASKICQCNHGSKKETHASAEDKHFASVGIGSGSGIGSADHHADHEIPKTIKPSCHDAKEGEAHLCSCKKKKKEASNLRPHHQTFERVQFVSSTPAKQNLVSFIPSEPSMRLTDGNPFYLIKPPRI